MAAPSNDALSLRNGVIIPQLGFGVYNSPVDLCLQSCATALEAGYRHIDTGQYYGNEKEVGLAIQRSNIPRREVFLTTKILETGSYEEDYAKCLTSVKALDPKDNFVDCFLIHSPNVGKGKRAQLWAVLERLYKEGRAKSIGVSNFGIQHIEELKQSATVWPPHVNQIELHPWAQQREIVLYCTQHKIVVEAYCPLVRGQKLEDTTLQHIANKHDAEPGQVLIRYSLQKGWVPLPKSDNPARIKANCNVYHFKLDDIDMVELDSLDQGSQGNIVQAVDN